MNRFSSVFSQILKLFPRAEFEQFVRRTNAERHGRGFRSWDQFVSMLFCHLGRAQSLREICDGLRSMEGKLSHLGIDAPSRSTLAYANEHRPWELFREVFLALYARCREIVPGHGFRFNNKLYSLDASTVTLCSSVFDWARYKRRKGGIKVHLVLDHDGCLPAYASIGEAKKYDIEVARALEFPAGAIVVFDRGYNDFQWFYALTAREVGFVTRMKKGTRFRIVEERVPPSRSVVVDDQIIELIKEFEGVVPHRLRRVVVHDSVKGELVFLTNLFNLSAATIANIYRDRWQIEKFFRAIKQNLRVKTFVGTSENALQTQIWTALIAMLVLRYLMLQATFGWSLSNFVAMLRHHLFSHRDLFAWLNDPFLSDPPEPQLAIQFG